MTNEEMKRALEFLVKNQASFDDRLEQTNQQIAETNRQLQVYAETQTEFIQIVTRTLEAQAEINASFRVAIARIDERGNKTDERLDRLAEMNARTDERLDRLAEVNARTDERLERMAEVNARTDARLDRMAEMNAQTDARLDRMAEMNAQTDARLDRLAATVERNITGGNGSA